jgi:septation ring formation regulator EzrA
MAEEKWSVERIHKEIQDARTKMFVVTKVLEAGNIKFSDCPEWVLVIKPILADLQTNTQKISEMIEPEKSE